ncbi:hypothetical protein [Actinoplanes sp. NPDC051851]|uniref:hypothetical protein n=1 Tax=Actinoplanes sp. NPDC051851 TaxID=3154753 RepID=UPI00342AF7DD
MRQGLDRTRPDQNRTAGPRLHRTHLAPEAARLHLLQRSIGNAAVGQVVQRALAPLAPEEAARREGLLTQAVKVTPQGYATAHGKDDVTRLTRPQLMDYLVIAVLDDLDAAIGMAATDEQESRLKAEKTKVDTLRRNVRTLTAGQEVGEQAAFLDGLIPLINQALRGRSAHATRYSVNPQLQGHQHNVLNKGSQQAMSTTWADDQEMWDKAGPALGTAGFETGPSAARTPGQLPIERLTWAKARAILPRPMLNLLFDVRYQLESGSLLDERTADERGRRVKSPTEPGTLRSWHQDDAGKLPKASQENVPAESALLQDHYHRASQSGAGSSVQNAAEAPRGLAEYTGAGSKGEHNTKIVLDYRSKRIYLTLTHYQYWALVKVDGTTEFWPLETQSEEDARGRMETRRADRKITPELMSPWIEIDMGTPRPQAT